MWEKAELLLLLMAANGAPVLLTKALGPRMDYPLDAGVVLGDGHRLLGGHSTVRGVAGAMVTTAGLAALLGHSARAGAVMGLLAMAGDAASSFVKRRLDLESGAKATGLDQVPESLLPLLAVANRYRLTWWDLGLLVSTFTLLHILGSRLLFKLKLRKRPH